MTDQSADISPEDLLRAFGRIMSSVPTRLLSYTIQLCTLAFIAFNTDLNTLPPGVALMASGIGTGLISDLLIRVARGNADEAEIQRVVQEAIDHADRNLLDNIQFQQAIAQILRQNRHLGFFIENRLNQLEHNQLLMHEDVVAIRAAVEAIESRNMPFTLVLEGNHPNIQGDAFSEVATQNFPPHVVIPVSSYRDLTSELERETESRFEEFRQAALEGRVEEALSWLSQLRNNQTIWDGDVLSRENKAKYLRLEASLLIHTRRNVELANDFANQAQQLYPSESHDLRLSAIIARARSGPETAIEILSDHDDIDVRNLHARFLLEMGNTQESLQILRFNAEQATADTFQVRALCELTLGNLDQARLNIQRALTLAPNTKHIRYAAATIDYHSALSPAAIPDTLVAWPDAISWDLVKTDDESIRSLEAALDIFTDLASMTQGNEQIAMEGWRLACLANLRNRQSEASQYCQDLIERRLNHIPGIRWGIIRGYLEDLSNSETQLAEQVTGGTAEPADIDTLLKIYHLTGRDQHAVELIRDSRTIFEQRQLADWWVGLYAHSLAVGNEYDEALALIDTHPASSDLRKTRVIVLSLRALYQNVWEPLLNYLEQSYEETDDPYYLFEACQLFAQQGNWQFVRDRSELLLEQIGTGTAVVLIAEALYRGDDFNECLALIDSYRHLFHEGHLPQALRHLRIVCQRDLGLIPEAIQEARDLASENSSVVNLLNLARIYWETGDFSNLVPTAQLLFEHPDLPPEEGLRLAFRLRSVNRGLSLSLWQRFANSELPDDLVVSALTLGFQLGQDETEELAQLQQRMNSLASQGQGEVRSISTDEELRDILQRWAEHHRDIYEMYQNGQISIHRFCGTLQTSLVDIYRSTPLLREESPDPLRHEALYFYHGSRAHSWDFPERAPSWIINLDVTGLLLAHHLNILDLVEEVFHPIRIPAGLLPVLIQDRERLEHQQPNQIPLYQQVIDLVSDGHMQTLAHPRSMPIAESGELDSSWGEYFVSLHQEGNYFVCFDNLYHQLAALLPDELNQHIVNIPTLLSALPLSANTLSQALARLGSEGEAQVLPFNPEMGSSLVCYGNIPVELARIGVLADVREQYRHIYISDIEFERLRLELQIISSHEETAQWLTELIGRLNRGLHSGIYQRLPISSPETTSGSDDVPVEVDCIFELDRLPFAENHVVWIDDRYTTGFRTNRHGNPVVTIVDVLRVLVGRGDLSHSEYYDRLHRLRAANVRFLPITLDEILHHLRQTQPDGTGSVVETPQLRVFRRYVAACLLQSDRLQTPVESATGQPGELDFLLGTRQTVSVALARLWSDSILRDDPVPYANWLLENLYIDLPSLSAMSPLQPAVNDNVYLAGVSLALLVSHAFELEIIRDNEQESAVTRYLDWLNFFLLAPKLDSEPSLVVPIANALSSAFETIQRDFIRPARDDEDTEMVLRYILQRFFLGLPEQIREEMTQNTQLMEELGLVHGPFINIANHQFRWSEFWSAASDAVNGEAASASPLGADHPATFAPLREEDGVPGFVIELGNTEDTVTIRRPDFYLLLDDLSAREREIRSRRRSFDCSQDTLEQIIAEVLTTRNPAGRIQAVRQWEDSSAFLFYQRLYGGIRKTSQVNFEELMPPDTQGLLRHLRISPVDLEGTELSYVDILNSSAQLLLQEEGLLDTIERLASLPIPLPEPVMQMFRDLEPSGKRRLIKILLRVTGSPVSRLHFLRLLLLDSNMPSFVRLAQRLIRFMLSDVGREEYQAFIAILTWANEEFGRWPEARTQSVRNRLTMLWLHTHRLFTILTRLQLTPDWIRLRFSQLASARLSFEAFDREQEYWYDIAHPRQVNQSNWGLFLLTGFSYSMNESLWEDMLQDIREALLPYIVIDIGSNQIFPTVPLFRDHSRIYNSLGSFLGEDISEEVSSLFGLQESDRLSVESLQQFARDLLLSLQDRNDDFSAWWNLWLLSPQLLEADASDQLTDILMGIDFVELHSQNPNIGLQAMQVATRHLTNIRDEELRNHLESQIVSLARYGNTVARSERQPIPEDFALMLLEAALNISLSSGEQAATIQEFARLFEAILQDWNRIPSTIKLLLLRLSNELPINQALPFLRLLTVVRAA